MINRFKIILIASIAILLINNNLSAQNKMEISADLILIKKLPIASEILNLSMHHSFNSKSVLDESKFLLLLDKAKIVQPNDKILKQWNYAPWYSIEFTTSSGKYNLQIFLGGLGIMTLPDGTKGAIMLDIKEK